MPNLPRILRSPKAKVIAIFVVVLVIVGIIVALVIQSRHMQVTSLDNQAQSSMATGNFADAQKKLTQALALDSGNAKILADTITAIAAEGNATGKEADAQVKAKPYVDQALKSNPNNVLVLTAIGYLLETGGKYQDAINYYDKALKINPKSGQTLFRKAHALQFLNGNTKEVQDLYDLAFKNNQNDPLIVMFQGRKYGQSGELDKAYNSFIFVAKNAKQNDLRAEAYADAYLIKEAQGKYDEAKNLAMWAVDLDRNYGPGLVYYGNELARGGNFKDAATFMVEAADKNPRASLPYWYLGSLMRTTKFYKQAVAFLQKGIDMTANDNTILGPDAKKFTVARMTYDIGKTYYASGDATRALEVFAQAEAVDKNATVTAIKTDQIKFAFYKNIENDPRFTALLK